MKPEESAKYIRYCELVEECLKTLDYNACGFPDEVTQEDIRADFLDEEKKIWKQVNDEFASGKLDEEIASYREPILRKLRK